MQNHQGQNGFAMTVSGGHVEDFRVTNPQSPKWKMPHQRHRSPNRIGALHRSSSTRRLLHLGNQRNDSLHPTACIPICQGTRELLIRMPLGISHTKDGVAQAIPAGHGREPKGGNIETLGEQTWRNMEKQLDKKGLCKYSAKTWHRN